MSECQADGRQITGVRRFPRSGLQLAAGQARESGAEQALGMIEQEGVKPASIAQHYGDRNRETQRDY